MKGPSRDISRRRALKGGVGAIAGGIGLSTFSGTVGATGRGVALLSDEDGDGVYGIRLDRETTGSGRPNAVHAESQSTSPGQSEGNSDYAISLPNVSNQDLTLGGAFSAGISFEYYDAGGERDSVPDEVWLKVDDDGAVRYLVASTGDGNGENKWDTWKVTAAQDWLILDSNFQPRGSTGSGGPGSDLLDADLLNAGVGVGNPPFNGTDYPVFDAYFANLEIGSTSHDFPPTAQDNARGNTENYDIPL